MSVPNRYISARSDFLQPALEKLSDVHRRVIELGGPLGLGFDHKPAKMVAGLINDQFGRIAERCIQ